MMNNNNMMEISQFDRFQESLVNKIVSDNPSITDDKVYDEMVKAINNIQWYTESSGQLRKDGSIYYPPMNPIGGRKNYKEWYIELQQIASKYRTFDKQFKSFVDNWNPNPYKFAQAVSKLFFNISNNEEALENVRKHFANIQYNIRK